MNAYPRAVRRFGDAGQAARRADRRLRPAGSPPAPRRRPVIRLWLPLTPLFLLLAPFALLLSPLAFLAPRQLRGANPILAAVLIGRLLMSLSGTEIDVDSVHARVHIRIF